MIKDYTAKLEQLWGPFSDLGNSIANGSPAYMQNGLKFNYIFKPIPINCYIEFGKRTKTELPDDLMDLYAECNGLRLFLSSLSIYGLQARTSQMEPYDLAIENMNNRARLGKQADSLFFFGAFGRDYVFAYDLPGNHEIKCISFKTGEELLRFTKVNELLDCFIPRICTLYDSACNKKHPALEFSGIPALENATFRIEEIS